MPVHVFQIANLNSNLFTGGDIFAGAYVSENAQQPDNINGNLARYYGIQGVWAEVTTEGGLQQVNSNAGSYGMPTGVNDTIGDGSRPWRPAGGFFLRGVWFADNSVPPTSTKFRDGYYGSFQSGLYQADYAHDPSTLSVDYETLYGHGVLRGWPLPVYTNAPNVLPTGMATQFLDTNNITSDAGLTCTNSGSAYTRTPYMPPSYFNLFCSNNPAGAATLSSGNVKFFFENRPSLRVQGYEDASAREDTGSPTVCGSISVGNQTSGSPYTSDPTRGYGTSPATRNPSEFFQVTGVRKLNSRGLSFHLAKVFDNGFNAYPYQWEEDGTTVHSNQPVNVQQQYLWQRGLEYPVTSTTVASTVATFTCGNSLTAGQQVILYGFTTHQEYNGKVVTVLSTGLSSLQFEANWTGSNYGPAAETTAVASYGNDARVRQAAHFQINEEYYGFVMDTKCTIWSNKSSMIPFLFFDLMDTWTASVAPRIAGVSVTGVGQNPVTSVTVNGSNVVTVTANNNYKAGDAVLIQGLTNATFLNTQTLTVLTSSPTQFTASFTHAAYGPTAEQFGSAGGYKVWFLSEDGFLAVYDFTQLNGAISLLGPTAGVAPNAPTPATGYAYGAMKASADGGTLYAVYGHVAEDPRLSTQSASSPTVGVIAYSVSGGAWGSVSNMPNPARHNGRSLSEMIVLRDGRIALMVEEVSYVGTTVTNYLMGTGTAPAYTNVQWQVAIYDGVTTWNTAVIDGNVAPASSPLHANITNVQSSGGVLTYTVSAMTTAFPVGAVITTRDTTVSNYVLNGKLMTVLASPAPTTTSFAVDVPNNYVATPSQADSGTASQGISYGTNFMEFGNRPTGNPDGGSYWFGKPNAFLHDIGPNKLLVQGNWTAGALWVLDISGSTASTSNSNLTPVPSTALWSYSAGGQFAGSDPYITQNLVDPGTQPISFAHARDFLTNADRTLVVVHDVLTPIPPLPVYPVYLAPPGFNWASPGYLSITYPNTTSGVTVRTVNKDYWSVQDLSSPEGSAFNQWTFPTMLWDNYAHLLRISGGGPGWIYAIAAGQTLGFLPTYFKWSGKGDGANTPASVTQVQVSSNVLTVQATNTLSAGDLVTFSGLATATFLNGVSVRVLSTGLSGSQFEANYTYPNYGPTADTGSAQVLWLMADGFADAYSNSFTIPGGSFSAPIPLPYGLQVSFGPAGSDSFTSVSEPTTVQNSEYFTFNVAWGNTKFARKSRNTWAMFAGQTFLWTEPHTVAQENTMKFLLWDTDQSTVTTTAPTNVVGGASATVTPNFLGWNTAVTWPKLDVSNNAFDATPLKVHIAPNNFDPATMVYGAPQVGPTGSLNQGPWTWTVPSTGGTTYVSTAGSATSSGLSWYAFAGRPDIFWSGNAGNIDQITIDLGAAQMIAGYSFRPYFNSPGSPNGAPATWVVQGSNSSMTGPWTPIDSKTVSSWSRGMAFNSASPGLFRYVQFSVTATNDNASPNISMIQYYSAVRGTTFNFQDIVLFSYGNNNANQVANSPLYLMCANFVRGLKFEVSTTASPVYPANYTAITPLWRAHMGYVFTFPRQTAVTGLVITVQQGYNCCGQSGFGGAFGGNIPATAAAGPFYLVDYGSDPTATGCALGSSSAANATPPRGSYDPQCLGIAGDAISVSLDSGSPSAFQPYFNVPNGSGGVVGGYGPYSQLLGFWDMSVVTPNTFKVHPFFGFLLFEGAGQNNGVSTQPGTNLSLTYNWGRRV